MTLCPIINADELKALFKNADVVVVDASGGKDAVSNYAKKHLKGALFADVNEQLANVGDDAAKGGRHPLPTVAQFSQTLSQLGITPETHVVVYDDMNGANAAARFWWMLRAIGHERVQVLNGGLQAAERAGLPISSGVETPRKAVHYPIGGWQLPQAEMAEVERVSGSDSHIVLDVRDANRYAGLVEPIDLIAGHIPGAVNVPFSTNLQSDGRFKSPEELKGKYKKLMGGLPSEHVIVHCGSGVTACHTLLAAAYAGLDIPKLYVGSWSEWSRNDKAMVTQPSTGK